MAFNVDTTAKLPRDRRLSGDELDQLVGITGELMDDAVRMHESGETPDAIIWHLQRNKVSKPGVSFILHRKRILPSSEIKRALHFHPAFGERRKGDEQFLEEIALLWQATESEEQHAA